MRLEFLEKYTIEGHHYDREAELNKAIDELRTNPFFVYKLAKRPDLSEHHIQRIIDTPGVGLFHITDRQDLTKHHIEQLLNNNGLRIQQSVIAHHQLTPDQIATQIPLHFHNAHHVVKYQKNLEPRHFEQLKPYIKDENNASDMVYSLSHRMDLPHDFVHHIIDNSEFHNNLLTSHASPHYIQHDHLHKIMDKSVIDVSNVLLYAAKHKTHPSVIERLKADKSIPENIKILIRDR